MYLIGLTGGIAAGKSTIAARLASHGAVIIDADQVAREVVEPGTAALEQIVQTFGPGMVRADGTLNRAALGSHVFQNADALSQLNQIVHPAVRRRTAQLIARASAVDPDAIVVYDVPLLVEAAIEIPFDLIVVAHAPAETRVKRLVTLRGMSEADARARVLAQAGDDQRLAVADVVIDTGDTKQHTLTQTDELWQRVRSREG
ncbi:dephospho-CoA kinase [Homoserinimonas sp. OAct 916]|uniref:dephospho-CoA kinase n=1 Tax=Homoserinimonas sp. OAct 916 TaxID=2211450 RepID=UPI000DBE04E2|nr:dephospho-CoA kinase [Homoserinimonas sp. OAct 916]